MVQVRNYETEPKLFKTPKFTSSITPKGTAFTDQPTKPITHHLSPISHSWRTRAKPFYEFPFRSADTECKGKTHHPLPIPHHL